MLWKITVFAHHVISFELDLAKNASITVVNALPKRPGCINSSLNVYPSQQLSDTYDISAQGTHFIFWQWPKMSNLSKFISFDPLSEFEHNFGYSPPRRLISRAWDALSGSTPESCYSWSFFASFSPNKVGLSALCAPNMTKIRAFMQLFGTIFRIISGRVARISRLTNFSPKSASIDAT